MQRYLVDFEFSTPDGRIYWMPLAISASSIDDASETANRLQHGLAEKYNVDRFGPYPSGSYSEGLLLEYRRGHRQGTPEILEINEYRFRKIPFDSALSFDEHLEVAALNANEVLPEDSEVVASIKRRTINVRLVDEGSVRNLGEVLVVNVIMPNEATTSGARAIPAESAKLDTVSGRQFRATIYKTPDGLVAAEVIIDSSASQLQLDAERMNTRIFEAAERATGRQPDYYSTRRE